MSRTIALPLRGGGQRGACRYEVTREPLAVYVCHCTDGQRQSMRRLRDGEAGGAHRLRRDGGRAAPVVPDGGERLFHLPFRNEAVVNVKPGRSTPWEGSDPWRISGRRAEGVH